MGFQTPGYRSQRSDDTDMEPTVCVYTFPYIYLLSIYLEINFK